MINEISFVIVAAAAVVAVATAWLIAAARARGKYAGDLKTQTERATAAEARVDEIRGLLETARQDFETLRDRLREAERAKVAAETTAAEVDKNLAAQKALLADAKQVLTDTFKSLAAEVLSGSQERFFALAEDKFKTLRESAAGDLESRKKAVEALIEPLTKTLSDYQKEMNRLEVSHQGALSTVTEHIRAHADATSKLQVETGKLVNALRSPQVRGRWGEIALKKTAELAGMSPYCDFVEQVTVEGDEGLLRPDMIVKLPAGREVVVDSKVPLGAFLEAIEAETEEERDAALVKHAGQVNQHVRKLAAKNYWRQFDSTPEFVVLFIPNDSFLVAAAEINPNLVEYALTENVIIATPSTFIALLKAIAFGWRQEQITEHAREIASLGQTLSDRLATFVRHLVKVGAAMGKAVESYNEAVGSLESRVMPSARKFKEIATSRGRDIKSVPAIEKSLRHPVEPSADESNQ